MTISSTVRKAGPYAGNDVTTAFAFAFKVFSAADIYVVRLDEDTGIESVLVLTTDYTVSLNANQNANPGGTVTLLTALETGQTLTITSDIAALQQTDLTNQGGFYPAVITNALDKLTIVDQQILEELDRSLTLPLSTPSGSVSTELPAPSSMAIIGWNNDGDALVNYSAESLAGSVATVDWATSVFNGDGVTTTFVLARDPGVASNCDVSISGVSQIAGIDFTVTGSSITFTTAPPAGTNNVAVRYGAALPGGVSLVLDYGSIT